MEKFTQKQKKIGLIAIIVISALIFIFINRGRLNHNKEIKKELTIGITDSAKDFHISSQSTMLWDDKTLYFCDKSGEPFKKITRKEENLTVFFTNNYAFIYDPDIKKLYEYSELGEHLNTIKVPAEVFNVEYQNKNIIIHAKRNGTEYLYNLKTDGSLNEAYKTDNYILTYDIEEPKKNYAVTEITTSANGYKNILTYAIDGEKKTKEALSEVGLFVCSNKKSTTLITDKNIYKFTKDENITKKVPNISDVISDGNNLYLLHSGIISKYNKNLEETEKYILAANVEKIIKVSNSLYAYGKNDIGGEIGTRNEFYTRLGSSVEKVEINGLTIAALKEGRVSIYKVVNSRDHNKNTLKDISKEQDKKND